MKISLFVMLLLVITLTLFYVFGRGLWFPYYSQVLGQRTVLQVIDQYGVAARKSMKIDFEAAGVSYPPKAVTFLAMKDTKLLEVWATDDQRWSLIKTYPIKAASGQLGPKLREGDRQVPEGIYKIIGFNPNSSYHLSMKLNYPNAFDQKWADKENRTEPGSNIFIHGKAVSIGCLAMGDEAIEELFVLSHDVGKGNIKVVIAPTDPRVKPLTPPLDSPPWVKYLYQNITNAFEIIGQ